MPLGYTDAHKIGDYLGRALTAQQFAQATQLVDVVEAYINRRTGRVWLNGTTVTDELHTLSGTYTYLTQHPVVAITSIEVRASETDTDTVAAATDYVLVDAATGLLALPWAYHGWRARITYTHAGPPLPVDLAFAATMLGAYWLQPHLVGGSQSAVTGGGASDPSIKRYSVGQDLTVEYFDTSATSTSSATTTAAEIPHDIRTVIDAYRTRTKIFA